MLSDTNIGIQKACYALNRLAGKTNLHRELIKAGTLNIELLPDLPVFIKLKVKAALSPCIFSFQYQQRGSLSAFASLRHKLPDEKLHEFTKENPKRLTITAPPKKTDKPYDEKVFEEDYIYLKLESYQPCRFVLKANFGK